MLGPVVLQEVTHPLIPLTKMQVQGSPQWMAMALLLPPIVLMEVVEEAENTLSSRLLVVRAALVVDEALGRVRLFLPSARATTSAPWLSAKLAIRPRLKQRIMAEQSTAELSASLLSAFSID